MSAKCITLIVIIWHARVYLLNYRAHSYQYFNSNNRLSVYLYDMMIIKRMFSSMFN